MSTWGNILFYLTFLSQIFLISYHIPGKVLARMQTVLKTYPPSEYPRLYPKPMEYYMKGHWTYKLINQGILVLGLVILFLIVFVVDHSSFADDGFISEAWPAVYGMIQFVPLALLEFSELSQLKLMRKANTASTRKAELRRRQLFDFVSPAVLGMAVALFLGVFIFTGSVDQLSLDFGRDSMRRLVVLAATNLFLAAVGAWILVGQKFNPHEAFVDRARRIAVGLNSMLYLSMALSVFFMTQVADDLYDLDFLDATLMSLFFQVNFFLSIGHVLRNLKLEDIDFKVYKNDPEAIA